MKPLKLRGRSQQQITYGNGRQKQRAEQATLAGRSNLARKNDRLKKAERKLVRLGSRGARRRTLRRQVARIAGLKKRIELSRKENANG